MAHWKTIIIMKNVLFFFTSLSFLLNGCYGEDQSELKENSWLTLPATPEIVFNTELSSVWELSLSELGIKPSQISSNFGNA